MLCGADSALGSVVHDQVALREPGHHATLTPSCRHGSVCFLSRYPSLSFTQSCHEDVIMEPRMLVKLVCHWEESVRASMHQLLLHRLVPIQSLHAHVVFFVHLSE